MPVTKKICVVGPSGSGKSRMVHEILLQQPSNIQQPPTLGVDMHPMSIDDNKYINVWDCAGTYFGNDNPSKFYKACDLFIIVFPADWVESQKSMWLEYVNLASPNTKIYTCVYPNPNVMELTNAINSIFN